MSDYHDNHDFTSDTTDLWHMPFSDVDPNHWAFEAIERIKKRRVMAGYPDGTFRPEKPVSRAELASALDKDYINRFSIIGNCGLSVVRVEAGRKETDKYPEEKILSIGSGVVLDTNGYIATNVHVVLPGLDGGFVRVIFNNGKKVEAKVPYGDGARDCAILKVDPCLINFVRTDAAINPGNSGGGLFNRYGEFVAMPTRKYVKIGDIPIDNIAICLAGEEVMQVWNMLKLGMVGLKNAESLDVAYAEVGDML
jgi:S1-C subfamily serine protease